MQPDTPQQLLPWPEVRAGGPRQPSKAVQARPAAGAPPADRVSQAPTVASAAGPLLTGAAVLYIGRRSRPLRRSRPGVAAGRKRLPRGALIDDLSLATEEALNTLEDAAIHLARLRPWLPWARDSVLEPGAAAEGPAPEAPAAVRRRRVVVLGTGWAAHALAKVVDLTVSDVCIISPRNYFVFTPMLAAAAVGTVEYRSILEHIRSANPTLRFYQGICQAIDVERHEITVHPVAGDGGVAFSVPYDVLVVSVGLRPSTFGIPGAGEHALFMKSVEDARDVRRRVTECFEKADLPTASNTERQRLLTFAVVGGGPTGCEFCGELSDFVRNDLRRFYPRLAPLVRICLLQRGNTILPAFGPDLQQAARETLEAQGIEVLTGTRVVSVSAESLTLRRSSAAAEEHLPCGMCVWAAGNRSQDVAEALCAQVTAQREAGAGDGRGILVDDWLRVVGVPDGSVLALGDCAQLVGAAPPLPQTAQVAAQQGAYAARLLNRRYDLSCEGPPCMAKDAEPLELLRARGQQEAPPFRFLDLGRLAYLGKEQAVAEVSLGSTAVSSAAGRAAFLLWRSVYVVKQVSFRNRVLVLFDWVKSKVFGRDLTRI